VQWLLFFAAEIYNICLDYAARAKLLSGLCGISCTACIYMDSVESRSKGPAHRDASETRCPICGKVFDTVAEKQKHLTVEHMQKGEIPDESAPKKEEEKDGEGPP
jgi:uncharacterized C2H2 Zn-finger protein